MNEHDPAQAPERVNRPARPVPPLRLATRLILVLLSLSACTHRIIEPSVFVTGGQTTRAAVSCNQEFEAVLCSIDGANPGWVASFGFNRVSWAGPDFGDWAAGSGTTNPGFPVPVSPAESVGLASLSGDAWSTYSEAKDLVFVYFVGRPAGALNSCPAVAATSPADLVNGVWQFPAICLAAERGDQCAIEHVDSTNTFYIACKLDSTIRIRSFDDCQAAPGAANGCAETANVLMNDRGLQGLQFDLSGNPCSGNLMLTYRLNDEVRLRIFDSQLQQLADELVRDGQSFANGQTNEGCGNGTIRRCGLGGTDCCNPAAGNCGTAPQGQCLRVNGRPSIDTYLSTRINNPTCYAVIAYDSLVPARDGNLWSKSRLDLLDVTDESDIQSEARWVSTDDDETWNHYLSYAVIGDRGREGRSPAIGWFWMTDIRGPCNTIFEGATSINLAGSMAATGPISSPFSAAYTNAFGIGDYIRGAKGSDRDGALVASWGQTVNTSVPCVPCGRFEMNLATKAARVRWERKMKPRGRVPDLPSVPSRVEREP